METNFKMYQALQLGAAGQPGAAVQPGVAAGKGIESLAAAMEMSDGEQGEQTSFEAEVKRGGGGRKKAEPVTQIHIFHTHKEWVARGLPPSQLPSLSLNRVLKPFHSSSTFQPAFLLSPLRR